MLLRELFEAEGKTAAIAFGRMNPPTIGHEKLVNVIASQKADPFLFITQTQKPKTDPLPFNIKLQFAQAAFPQVTVGDENVKTIIQALQKVESMGYDNLIYVAGSDRVESFNELLNNYNGKDYTFKSIKVISAGERDPDAEGAEGMSASKMREAAMKDNFEAFAQGLPKGLQNNAKNVYSAVRTGMGIKELEPTEGVAEGYILKKTNVSKYTEPGDPDDYTPDVNIKDTDYEIINNKTGQIVGTASWTTNDYFGPGALKITMKNGAIRWLDIWEREKGNPQSAFNRFLKDPKTSKKYKEGQGVAEGSKDWDEGNTEPGNNFAVYINGKKWKVFPGPYGAYADSPEEEREFYRLKDMARKKSQQSGKKWEVFKTGESASK